MIRINIKKDTKVTVKSFVKKKELENYLFELTVAQTPIVRSGNPTNSIWNLNVGTSYKFLGYTFSMAGKSRAGNHLVI